MENKLIYGLIGLLSLIVLALGGTIYLTEDELNNAFVCTTNQNVVIAERLSSTMKTAYWTDELNVTKSKVCRNGIWMNLKQYAKDNNIEINVLLNNLNQEEPIPNEINQSISYNWGNVTRYSCNQINCSRVK